ncbi:MAG: DUF1959 domain-containing protein [Methanomicrobiales archaeon]|nr:DUF1959 domain-containing protein [Methanomicrobiales archaeon]
MMDVLYEKDLRPLKLHILESPRHRRTIREIGRRLGVEPGWLIRWAMAHFDMQLLENLPARFEQGLAHQGADDPLASAIGAELFTVYLPFFTTEEMNAALEQARERLGRGEGMEAVVKDTLRVLGRGFA